MSFAAALLALIGCSGGPPPVAADYCERTVDDFCDYYLRCGRMAVDDVATCHTVFLERCNAVYEPRYRTLEERGVLALSADGLDACAEHLQTVACDQQIGDLDGACAQLWTGLTPAGGACAPGVESLVCAEGTTCVLGLDLCGSCEATVATGATCGDGLRCQAADSCLDGVCVARGRPGDACDVVPCALGARCVDNLCQVPDIAGLGDTCDAFHPCAYASVCTGGTCNAVAWLGQSCDTTTPCGSGWCDAGTCAALFDDGVSCERGDQCVSGLCDGTCSALPGVCFE